MEALSGVASGFAVASLSIQLVESVGKVITFIRNVKNAPSEFIRLVELLERLHALLEDVRNVLERQSSLQGQHFPMPSMTIFKCLKSCENSFKPLQDTIDRYEESQAQRDSSLALMKGNAKFGLKVKDIASFEARIQQDIQYLTSALVLNNTSIAIQAPAILNTRTETSMILNTPIPNDQTSLVQRSGCHAEISTSITSIVRYSRRMSCIPSRFERLGLRKQRLVKSVYLNEEVTGGTSNSRREPCMEEDIYFWASQSLGYGISWSKRYPYGQILPSLTVYPVIGSFFGLPFNMATVSILEFQKLLTSNIIHPFLRNSLGESILHKAAGFLRGDICRLLIEYGVRPDLSFSDKSPLWMAMHCGLKFQGRVHGAIETFRILFEKSTVTDDFPETTFVALSPHRTKLGGKEIEEIWSLSLNVLSGEELLSFQWALFRTAIGICSSGRQVVHKAFISRFPDIRITSEFHHRIESGYCRLLSLIFSWYGNCFDSYSVGSAFILLLKKINIDFRLCISNELKKLPRGILQQFGNCYKRIIFKHSEELGWILGWEWEYDSASPVFLILSEFSTLLGIWDEWPFHQENFEDRNGLSRYFRADEKWASRFNRRTTNKARKEQARTGQKRARSKMPGAWV